MLTNDPIAVRITSNAQPISLPLTARVMKFSYEDVEKGDDMLNITFSDYDNLLVDSEQFNENTEWIVQWGFANKLHPARRVLVKRSRYRFGEIEVECLDKGSTLRLEERWDVEQNKTTKEIINKIAGRHGLSALVDNSLNTIIPYFAWGGRTDYDVLQYLRSRADNHVFKVISDKLVFQPRKLDEPPVATFEYAPGKSSRLISFDIAVKDQDNAKAAKQTTTLSVDPETLRKVIYKSDESNTATDNLGTRRPQDKFSSEYTKTIPSVSTITNTGGTGVKTVQGNGTGKSLVLPPKSTAEFESIAKAKRRESMLDSVEASIEIMASPDDPFMQSGDLIELRGIGKKFSGSYQIVEISHDLDSIYKYNIKARRNAVNATAFRSSKLNGKTNKKKGKNLDIDAVKKSIRGTRTGSLYSTIGGNLG